MVSISKSARTRRSHEVGVNTFADARPYYGSGNAGYKATAAKSAISRARAFPELGLFIVV